MPTITLYVKDADTDLIEKAKEKLGDSLSAAFVDCIKERMGLANRKITLGIWDNTGKPNLKRSFTGRWVVGNERKGMPTKDRGKNRGMEFSIAVTEKGQFVIYGQHVKRESQPFMMICESLEKLRNAEGEGGRPIVPEDVMAATIDALARAGEIKLDI